MARTVSIRPSYSQDGAFFLRVREAVGRDGRIDSGQRQEAMQNLSRLVELFSNFALQVDNGGSNEAKPRGKKR